MSLQGEMTELIGIQLVPVGGGGWDVTVTFTGLRRSTDRSLVSHRFESLDDALLFVHTIAGGIENDRSS